MKILAPNKDFVIHLQTDESFDLVLLLWGQMRGWIADCLLRNKWLEKNKLQRRPIVDFVFLNLNDESIENIL